MPNGSRFVASLIILAALQGCGMFSPPPELDLRTTRTSMAGKYVVSMRPMLEKVPVNKIHPWEILIVTASGSPVTGAHISFDGGMPQHSHGFPTQARVTEELQNGRYRLDGVKFSMTGWWEMKLRIQADQSNDNVTFNTIVR